MAKTFVLVYFFEIARASFQTAVINFENFVLHFALNKIIIPILIMYNNKGSFFIFLILKNNFLDKFLKSVSKKFRKGMTQVNILY